LAGAEKTAQSLAREGLGFLTYTPKLFCSLSEDTMPIKYYEAPEIKKQVDQLAEELELFHVVPQFVYCVRSRGSKAKRTIARIHGLGKLWQGVLNIPPSYTIEVISEIYDKMSSVEKEKTLIHELLHIPGGFSGGFRPHKGYVERRIVEDLYCKLQKTRAAKIAKGIGEKSHSFW
jgi:predicted metallopeptidase